MRSLSDHQVIQRDENGDATCFVPLARGYSSPSLRITCGDRAVSFSESHQATFRGEDYLEVKGVPTGGPYRFLISDGDARSVVEIDDLWVGDLWVLAGQSNMAGIGELSQRLPPLEASRMLSFDRTWKTTFEPIHRFWETKDSAQYKMTPHLGFDISSDELDRTYEEMQPMDAVEPVGGVGPGAFFAQRLIDLSGVPVGLLPCALSGSPLDMWQTDFHERHDVPFEDTLYGDLLHRVQAAGARVRGVLWYQGESDALPEASKTYLERFERFVADVRSDLEDPGLPFVTVQLGSVENLDGWTTEDSIERIREAQRLAGERLDRVEVVAAADLPRNDHVHISGAGQKVLGRRMADAATEFLPDLETRYTVPRLEGVATTEDGVEVNFDGVNGSLRSEGGALSEGFEVTGNQVLEARISSPRSVRLVTARPMGTTGTEDVYYARGLAPSLPLTDEAGFPIPTFGPVRPGR